MEQLLEYDTALFQFLNGLGTASWDKFWHIVTLKWSSIPLYMVLLYLIHKKYGTKPTLLVLVIVALMITATDQLANLFKHGFQRPRPCQVESLKDTIRFVAERCGRYGYFSAHAASSMAAAVFCSLVLKPYYKKLIFLLLFWAVFVAYSRIYLGVHYPLDIVTGMAIGGLIGYSFYRLFKYLNTTYLLAHKI